MTEIKMPPVQGFWESPEHFVNTKLSVTPRIQKMHDEGHFAWAMHGFDYFCVAHGPDYSPKYLNGEYCHDGEECHPDCRPCWGMRTCPVVPCPIPDDE